LYIFPERNAGHTVQWEVKSRSGIVIGRYYFTRQARTLLKFAQSTNNPQLAAVLVEKATALKSQVDESSATPDLSPLAPDVEPETDAANERSRG
jgi:hypothetical protein